MDTGLDGVVAAITNLSQVDGEAGRLIVRGHDIEELAADYDFADMAALLWDGLVPVDQGSAAIRRALGQARLRAAEKLPHLLPAAKGLSAIEGLRAGLAMLADDDCDHVLLCAAVPVFTAALWRQGQGEGPVAPDPTKGQAEDFLAMLTDGAADRASARPWRPISSPWPTMASMPPPSPLGSWPRPGPGSSRRWWLRFAP
jgi:citrate synthase